MHFQFLLLFASIAFRTLYSPSRHHFNISTLSIPTASTQFAHLKTLPVHYFLKARRLSIPLNVHFSSIVTLLVILSGDIHLNPGPSSSNINLGTLNIRSLFHENRSVAIPDLIKSHDIHILALSETWQNQSTTPAQLCDITPPGFEFLGQPRIPTAHLPVTTCLAVVSDSSSGITSKLSYTHCPHTNLLNLSPSP